MQLNNLGSLAIATDIVAGNPNDFDKISKAVKNLGTNNASTTLLSSTLADYEKINFLSTKDYL